MSDPDLKKLIRAVKDRLRVTKVVATRSFKGKRGDSFAGFSAAWDTVQEDGGQGLLSVAEEGAESANGMTLIEAKIAHYLVAMQADIAAHEQALAGGNLSPSACADAKRVIKNNYSKLIRDATSGME